MEQIISYPLKDQLTQKEIKVSVVNVKNNIKKQLLF